MHKIHDKELDLSDFSWEHLCTQDIALLEGTIGVLNYRRQQYLELKDTDPKAAKEAWYSMIQLLPTSYEQQRTIMLNYEVLANIYESRKNHKLAEWHIFCKWIESLPYSEIITGESDANG
jgi:hypothetical protein